ncbi:hypothetical protein [Paenibacillus sp. FSL L8-0494]
MEKKKKSREILDICKFCLEAAILDAETKACVSASMKQNNELV